MANVGTAAAGKTIIGAGVGASPTFADIGTNSGLTNNGVLIAKGTGAFQATAAGTTGQVLTGVTGANPTWTTPTSGGNVVGPGTSTDRAIPSYNGTTGALLFNNTSPIISSTGVVTNSRQPAFSAYVNTSMANATGDGTAVVVNFNVEFYDQANNFASGTTFTAPVTGRYSFSTNVLITAAAAGNTFEVYFLINGTNIVYASYIKCSAADTAGSLQGGGVINYPLSANDTVQVVCKVSGTTKTVGIAGSGGATVYGTFSGYLIC